MSVVFSAHSDCSIDNSIDCPFICVKSDQMWSQPCVVLLTWIKTRLHMPLVWKSIYRENSIQTGDSHMEKWNNFMEQSGNVLEATLAEHIGFCQSHKRA